MSFSAREGISTASLARASGIDLRDSLKKSMPDLRAVIAANAPPQLPKERVRKQMDNQSRGEGGRGRSNSLREDSGGRVGIVREQESKTVVARRSLPAPNSAGRYNTPTDPKKIRVTVPGLSHARTETVPVSRRDERLSRSVAQQREQRHAAQARYREDYSAKSFASAVKETMYVPPVARVPSPPRERIMPMYGGASRGITTGTVLQISNLSDTVTRTDIVDLCEACGPIESLELLGRGVAEVVFLTKDDAQEAYRRYHRRNLDGQPMICKLLTDLRSSGFAMHSPPLTRYSGLSDLDAGWGYTGGF